MPSGVARHREPHIRLPQWPPAATPPADASAAAGSLQGHAFEPRGQERLRRRAVLTSPPVSISAATRGEGRPHTLPPPAARQRAANRTDAWSFCMRIMFIAPQPFFQERGTPISIDLLLRELSGRGDEVDLLTYHLGEKREYKGVSIGRIASAGGRASRQPCARAHPPQAFVRGIPQRGRARFQRARRPSGPQGETAGPAALTGPTAERGTLAAVRYLPGRGRPYRC